MCPIAGSASTSGSRGGSMRNDVLARASLAMCFAIQGCGTPGMPVGDDDDDTTSCDQPTMISVDTTWRAADGPHVVCGTVIVAGPDRPTLTIEPGTEVRFARDAELVIGSEVQAGALQANGTEDAPIVFDSAA